MWRQISHRLADYPGRLKVARTLVELGLSVKEGKIFCGDVEQSELKMARAIGVDRRTVRETAQIIESDPILQPVFKGLKPAGPFLPNVARFLGYRVIEIYADPHAVGIVTEASSLISQEGIAIRQAVADDPDLTPEPKLTLVVEREPSGDAIQKMLKIRGVTKVATYQLGDTLELEDLISIAREAGEGLARDFGKKHLSEIIGIGDSGDETIRADSLSEQIVLKRLKEIGNIEVMSEEAGRVVFGKPEHRVILDPLDGSSNYKRGIPLFSISIEVQTLPALEHVMAVIYEPMNRKMFSAEKGHGAFMDGSEIHTNQERPFKDCLFDLDLHTAADEKKFIKFVEAFRKFGLPLKSFRSVGSCAISLAYTACGTLDGFLDFTKNSRMVDIAAGLLILEEAGGVATDIRGNPITEKYDSLIACSTEQINREVRQLLLD